MTRIKPGTTAVSAAPEALAQSGASAGSDTRERLLRAAQRLFSTKGFDGATVKELSDYAGVNVSLVSYHFGGKEGLYRTCLEQFGRERLDMARRVLLPARTGEELRLRIRMFAEEMFCCHLENWELTQIIHRECDMEMPIAADIFRDTFIEVFKTFVEFLRAAQKKRVVRPELNPQILAGALFGAIMHYARSEKMNKVFFGNSLADRKYRDQVLDHFEALVSGSLAQKGEVTPS